MYGLSFIVENVGRVSIVFTPVLGVVFCFSDIRSLGLCLWVEYQ